MTRREKLELEERAHLTVEALEHYKSQMPPDWRAYANLCVAIELDQHGIKVVN